MSEFGLPKLGDGVRSKRILAFQGALVALCVIAVALCVSNFPLPSPLIKPLLPPHLRWPTAQIQAWVESGNFDGDYLEYFARDPERVVPAGRNLVSPADGVVQGIPVRDGITYFTVGLSFWDVHVVRTPMAGVVKNIEQEGIYFTRNAEKDQLKEAIFLRGKAVPVQQIVTLDTDYGEVKVRLITSYWASRLKLWVAIGQHLKKGERIGRILLGSTVVAELPESIKFAVQPGRRVVGGETIISEGDGQ
jgi:phosphatidylserine decarboxylase